MFNFKKKSAFTLAETLLVMTLLGVVAALTLPVMYGNYHEKLVVTRVKKFHQTMNEALNEAIFQNYGYTIDKWKNQNLEGFVDILKPHLSILLDCGTAGTECSYNGDYKLLNGEQWGNYTSNTNYYKMILADGAHMWIRFDGTACTGSELGYKNSDCSDADKPCGACGLMWFDYNGEKPPNTIGKDIFVFTILKNQIAPSRRDDCRATDKGWGCSGKAVMQGKLYR